MYCSNCGKEIKAGEKFCSQCGSVALCDKKQGKKKSKSWIIGVLAIIFMAICIGGVALWKGKNSQYEYLAYVENEEGKMGYINEKGKEIIECKYDTAEDFEENGLARVGIENGVDEEGEQTYLYGYINVKGEEIVPCEYENVSILSESGRIVVKKGGKEGLLNKNGEELIKCKYEYICWEIAGGKLIVVWQDGKYGCIDQKGNEIVPCIYDQIWEVETERDNNQVLIGVQDGAVMSDKDTKYGIMNEKGEVVVSLQDDFFGHFLKSKLIKVEEDGKYGFVDTNGKTVIPAEYDAAGAFGKNGLAVVRQAEESFIINESGEKVAECQNIYTYAKQFDDNGLACVYSEEGYGWVNESGIEVIPCRYKHVNEIFLDSGEKKIFDDNGLAIVEKNDKYGVINEKGEEVIPVEYDMVSDFFDNGLVAVEKDNKEGALNIRGEIVLPFDYDRITGVIHEQRYSNSRQWEIQNLGSNLIVVENGNVGLFDENGREIIPCMYTSFGKVDKDGYFVAYKEENGKSPVLLNLSGEVIIPEQYESIGESGENDLVAVYDGKQCSYVDRSGKTIIKLSDKYVGAGRFVRVKGRT